MLAEHMIQLEARKPSANRLREWRIELGRDLFGAWTVDIRFARIGSRGRLLRHSFASEAEVRAFVRRTLRRRASAPVRIGVAYRCVRATAEMRLVLEKLGIEPSVEFQERAAGGNSLGAGSPRDRIEAPELGRGRYAALTSPKLPEPRP